MSDEEHVRREPAGDEQPPVHAPGGAVEEDVAAAPAPDALAAQDEAGTPAEDSAQSASAPGMTAHDPADEERYRVADVVDPATVRRAPRYGRFMTVGLLAGAVIALLLAVLPLGHSDLGTGTLLAVLLLLLAPLGALLGAVVALLLDRRSMRNRTGPGGRAPSAG